MKYSKLIYLFAFLTTACYSTKSIEHQEKEYIKERAINEAILDFSQNCRLFKRDSVFSVSYEDTVYSLIIERTNKQSLQWALDKIYDDLVAVNIIAFADYKFYFSHETIEKLPTRYIIIDRKLFYWWDENYPVNDEIIEVLRKYNLLQVELSVPDFSTNGYQKGADYYFCKNNLSKYKRVITKTGFGYYKPPNLKCSHRCPAGTRSSLSAK